MKNIFLFILFLGLLIWLAADSLTGTSPSTTYKKIMVLDEDSLSTAVSAITDGAGNTLPLSISSDLLRMNTNKKLELYGTNNYLQGSDASTVVFNAGTTLTLNSGSKVQLFSASNYFDTSGNLVIAGDYTGVDGTFSGDVAIKGSDNPALAVTNNATIGGTLAVTGKSAFTGAITASGGVTGNVTGDLTGNVTSSGTSALTTVTCVTLTPSGTVNLTGSGTALDVDYNANIDGTLTVDLTSTLTGLVTATAGLNTDNIYEITPGAGVDIDGLDIKDGDIYLNGGGNFISFDADDDTYMYDKNIDDNIYIHIGGADDFLFTANTFTVLKGSKLQVDTIDETSSANGVAIDALQIEQKTSVITLYPTTGKYLAIVDSDIDENLSPTSHGLTESKDLYIEGKLEVDGATFFDGALTVAGATTLASLAFSGTDPEMYPSANESEDGDDFFIHGGDGSTNGGNLYLDGGSATTDGDVILGDNDGYVSINSPLLTPEYETLACDGGGIAAKLTEYYNCITATAADTITVADGVAGQHIKFIFFANASNYVITIAPTNCGWGTSTSINDIDESCELVFLNGKWYISDLND